MRPIAIVAFCFSCFFISSVTIADRSNLWRFPQIRSILPPPLAWHSTNSGVSQAYGNFVSVFGGMLRPPSTNNSRLLSNEAEYSDELWLYFLETLGWTLVETDGTVSPSARGFHVAEIINGTTGPSLIMFGGRNSHEFAMSDTWVYNFEEVFTAGLSLGSVWINVTQPNGPPGRWGASSTVLGRDMYIFGGCATQFFTDAPFADLWRFRDGTWTLMTPKTDMPVPRLLMYFTGFSDKKFVVTGGWGQSNSVPLEDNWIGELDSAGGNVVTWTKSVDTGVPLGSGYSVLVDDSVVAVMGMEYNFARTFSLDWFPVATNQGWVFDTTTEKWLFDAERKYVEGNGNVPPSTIGHSAAAVGNIVYLYGGYSNFFGIVISEFHSAFINLPDLNPKISPLVWTHPRINPSPSVPAYPAFATVNETFYLAGGWTPTYSDSSKVWQFHGEKHYWSQNPLSSLPSAAAGTATLAGGDIYFFGGVYQQRNSTPIIRNDLHKLILETGEVKLINTKNPPVARAMHTVVYHEASLYLFGGYTCLPGESNAECIDLWSRIDGFYFDGLYEYSILLNQWLPMFKGTDTPWPRKRALHTAAVLEGDNDNAMYVYGGMTNTEVYSDMWRFVFETKTWELLADLAPMGYRFGQCAAPLSSKKILYYGGRSPVNPDDHFLNAPVVVQDDIWLYDLESGTNYIGNNVTESFTQLEITSGDITPLRVTGAACAFIKNEFHVYGGQIRTFPKSLGQVFSIVPGCRAGYFSPNFKTSQCQKCIRGSYTNKASMSKCISCPQDITTRVDGATGLSDCNACSDNYCGDHGDCTVVSQGTSRASPIKPQCDCHFGFSGAKCETPLAIIIFVSIVVVALITGVMYYIYGRYTRHLTQLKEESSLREKLLGHAKTQLADMELGWEIKAEDIKVLNKVAAGSYGYVTRAEWHNHEVAVKTLRPELAELSHYFSKEFDEEVRVLRSLRHRNLVLFYGAGTTTELLDNVETVVPFLVTEFCVNGNLGDVLADKTIAIDITRGMGFAVDVAEGLSYLHSRKRIHRDIKSLNLFIDDRWTIKIGDLGSGRIISHLYNREDQFVMITNDGWMDSDAAAVTSGAGTTFWQPPESLRGERNHTQSVDVYSFGIVLWEIAARKFPYIGDLQDENENVDMAALRQQIIRGLRPNLSLLDTSYPREYVQLMRQCWEDQQEKRPSMVEVLEDLNAMMYSISQRRISNSHRFTENDYAMEPDLSNAYAPMSYDDKDTARLLGSEHSGVFLLRNTN